MVRNKSILLFILIYVLGSNPLKSNAQKDNDDSMEWTWNDGMIITRVPDRMGEQKSVLGLQVAPLEVVRVGFVGLGMRGSSAVERWTHIPGTQIVALCDYDAKRAEACLDYLKTATLPPAEIYFGEKGYEALCQRNDIDLVYIATDWLHHVPIAMCAMENGKHVAIEVPSAMKLKDCWDLINMSERKQLHCIILENCLYDQFEMNTLNMAQHGVFGNIIRAEGAYIHNLNDYWDLYWKSNENDKLGWRLDYNMRNRGDLYPTHGLGPIAQVMNLHRGDRLKLLIAMDTESFVGRKHVEQRTDTVCYYFANGDHTTTLLRTELGKVIEIQHNVMTPQPYSRKYQLTGTKGMAIKYPMEGYAIDYEQMNSSGIKPKYDDLTSHWWMNEEDRNSLESEYEHPIIKKYGELAKEVGGHGGMDFIMDSRLVYCLQNGLPMDMDVYDLAEWCCLAELGALSMNHNSAPVQVPDFTRGDWNKVEGYRHSFASPENEKMAQDKANAFTAKLKEQGTIYWGTSVNGLKNTGKSDSLFYSLKGVILRNKPDKEAYIHRGQVYMPK